jgi:PDZ domain-containing protein
VRAQKGTAVALFDESLDIEPRRRPPLRRSSRIGFAALAVALVILAALSFLPTGYVIQQPGPVYNTLGTAATGEGDEVPLISIEGAETFETTGSLDLTTVQVVGNRERTPSWIELVGAWFDSSRAVVPIASVFPAGQTSEQRNEESAQMMVDSQQEATAAALTAQGIDVGARVRVFSLPEGEPVDDVERLREIVQRGEGDPVALTVERGGQTEQVEILPEFSEDADAWQVGVSIIHDYDFPVDVTIQLDNVGGPSAGMMFALGIIDKLTEGSLNGGAAVAGTGTIDAAGEVGPIGGIRQKMFGAVDAGADWFLSPAQNCGEVVGHVPDGLQVLSVSTLDEALAALEGIAADDVSGLPTCDAAEPID